MELKVYISGSQLSSVAIGDSVDVRIDARVNPSNPEGYGQLDFITGGIHAQNHSTREERLTWFML